ncbi:host-nuclease inhibitor Gam family protein [Tissierella sp. MB52-C2]|uniref:host-nuclease inhibitor Gam family protein n=1 Tax=Tissierella sp. MB52-C2 TaxID=3070999 RepID=UPI00280BB41D|nr:host-nuclease inhibitor Gam family protein [Tissierella sp. MB52-C2]WMM24079.1 host-nuclease inhibitor Gam family protein [Tissierella sp. MB52-C2]
MSEILENTIDEHLEEVEKDRWRIKSDEEAEWWIDKKEEDLIEVRRFKISLENKIEILKEKLEAVKNEEKNIIQNRDFYLQEYFESIDEKQLKKTKTQSKYRLPSVELIKKFPGPNFERDDAKLTEWLESNSMNEFVEIKKQAKWGELKAATKVVNGQVVTEEGEIVEGVEVVERAPEFKVEV